MSMVKGDIHHDRDDAPERELLRRGMRLRGRLRLRGMWLRRRLRMLKCRQGRPEHRPASPLHSVNALYRFTTSFRSASYPRFGVSQRSASATLIPLRRA